MNSIQTFNSVQFGEVRVAESNGEPSFCLSDICKVLSLDSSQVIKRLDGGVVTIHPIQDNLGRTQQANFVNEDGLYDVILDSRKPEAKQFRKWVTSEVLPSIRKSGGYMLTVENETAEETLARALLIAQQTIDRSKQRVRELESENISLKPRALFADAVASSQRSVLVGELAKILNQRGVKIGQNRMFEWLRKNHYLCSKGEYYNQPTQKAMELGLFEIKKTSIQKPDGTTLVTTTTKVTGKGQIYFVNKFLNVPS